MDCRIRILTIKNKIKNPILCNLQKKTKKKSGVIKNIRILLLTHEFSLNNHVYI